MTLNEIKEILKAVALTSKGDMNVHFERVYSADLMSDVLAFCDSGSLLITALTNAQVIRTAEFAHIKAIIFVMGKRPDRETIALSEEKNIPLLATSLSMFDTCGRLYEKGLRSCPDAE
jgi:predicted transcriptional regulator